MYVRENNAGTTSCTLLAVFRVFTAAADRYCEYSHYYCHCVVFRGSVLLLYWGYDSADTFGLTLIIRDSIRGSALKIFSVLQVFRVSILLLLRVHIFACTLEIDSVLLVLSVYSQLLGLLSTHYILASSTSILSVLGLRVILERLLLCVREDFFYPERQKTSFFREEWKYFDVCAGFYSAGHKSNITQPRPHATFCNYN